MLLPQPDPPVIGVAWTLHYEVFFYAMAGAWIRFPVSISTIALILLAGSGLNSEHFLVQFLFSPFHWEFVAGIAAFAFLHRVPAQGARTLALVSGLAAVVACTWFAVHATFHTSPARYFTLAPLFALLVAASARFEAARARPADRLQRLGSPLGDSSYTLYLWHVPIATPMTKFVFMAWPALAPWGVLTLTIAISLLTAAVAHAIYRLIEQPVVNVLRKKMIPRRPARPQPVGTP